MSVVLPPVHIITGNLFISAVVPDEQAAAVEPAIAYHESQMPWRFPSKVGQNIGSFGEKKTSMNSAYW